MSTENVKRSLVCNQAWRYLGKPYIWAGDDPMEGFDCSGFVIELLKSVGKLPRKGDWTAHQLWMKFRDDYEVDEPRGGCLVFWKNHSGRIVHVELCLTDAESIGASGGSRTSKTVADAIAQNAFIKIRPIHSRAMIAGYIDLFPSAN